MVPYNVECDLWEDGSWVGGIGHDYHYRPERERAGWAIVVSFSSAVLGSELVGMGCLISNVDYC